MTPVWTDRGSASYRRIVIALVLSGYSTFSLLYCVQPLLPLFSGHFGLDAARSALALSLTTGLLAPSILLAGVISEATGRKALMAVSLGLAAALNLLAAAAPSWTALLILRALEGVALGGAPALAMTYLAEEIHPSALGRAMGLYVGGTAIGGFAGRLVSGMAAQATGWRGALAVIGLLGAASALAFLLLLPASRNFRRQSGQDPRFHLRAWLGHLRTPGLGRLFAVGALLMGSFVTLFNAVGYRLLASPYRLSQAAIGSIFVIYLLGTASSTAAGGLADRFGRTPVLAGALLLSVLGLLLTLAAPLALVIGGLGLFTVGFFAGHAVASGSVGRLARGAKAHAASLYLLCYYLGSSLLSPIGGRLWELGGWSAVAGFCAALLIAALLLAVLPVAAIRAAIAAGLLALALPVSVWAAEIPSPFLQAMTRVETPNAFPLPDAMPSLSALRIAGSVVQLGRTPIEQLGERLGVRVEHQATSGNVLYWLCVRLDVPPGARPKPEAEALSLWLVSDAEAAGPSHALSALAIDAVGAEARRCPAPARNIDLTLDGRVARPGVTTASLASLYGHAPVKNGRSSYSLPGMAPEPVPLTLTVSMRNKHVEASWIAITLEN